MARSIMGQAVLLAGLMLAAPAMADSGIRIDTRDLTGGVGRAAMADAAGAGGYGPVIFARDAGNGPTYNSYGQSFQRNVSRPGPFMPRRMGGLAPRAGR